MVQNSLRCSGRSHNNDVSLKLLAGQYELNPNSPSILYYLHTRVLSFFSSPVIFDNIRLFLDDQGSSINETKPRV
jgi:hypothetical protein